MKKVMYIIILMTLMLSTACKTIPASNETGESAEGEVSPEKEIEIEMEESVMDRFGELIVKGANAGDLGFFVRDNIADVSETEAEKMIELLVIEQQGMIERVNGLIYKPEYMDALNGAMEGVLNPALIPSISDEGVRADYQNLSDGFLTIVRYEETPSVETDWEALNGLREYFSDDFAEMTRLYDKIQNYRYDRREPNFKAIYEDALRTEELIFANQESFLTWQLDKLYRRQTGNLFIGAEGSYVGSFVSKNGEPYDSLIEASEEHPEAELSALVRALNDSDTEDFNTVVDMVNTFDAFGLKSLVKAVQGRNDVGNEIEGLIYVSIEGNPSIEKKINDTINETALDIKDLLGIENDISYRSTIMFGNGKYLSMIISASGTSETGDFEYEDRHIVIDMKTGEPISITDLFGIPWEDLSVELEVLTGKNIEAIPDFYLFRMGLAINIARENGEYYDYAVITFDDLIKYIPMETLYK